MKLRRVIFALVAALLPASALAGPESVLNPAGPAAGKLAQLGWVVFIVFGIVTVIVIGLLIWCACRRTGSLESHESWNAGGGQGWIVIGGLMIPIIILCGIYGLSLNRTTAFPLRDGSGIHPEILVVGHQWWWEVHYLAKPKSRCFTTANEIHIPVGRPVDIALQSADVIHSFWVPALHGKVQLVPGLTNYIRIKASRAGNFKGQCAVYCGEEHALMRLLVVAQPPEVYQAWYNNQLKPAVEPKSPRARYGKEVFDQSACAICHTVRGTVAQGRVAPDLTHLASRQYIASNSYPNDKAYLEAWITHAQSLKPGAQMPNLTMYSGKDLQAMVDYLLQLN